MSYSVVYASRTGNTELLAEEIRKVKGEEDCVYFGAPGENIPEADLIFAGFWTDKGDCSEETARFLEGLHGQKVFLFGTAGFGGQESYFERILERVANHLASDNEVAGTYMCQGKMPESVRSRYEGMLQQNPEDERTKAMLENFSRALGHPDQRDLEQLRLTVGEE